MRTTEAPGRWTFGGLGGRLGLRLGLLLAVLCGAALFHFAIADLWWGVTHHWKASGFGTTFEVPPGWRQIDRPERTQRVDLRNAMDDVRSALVPDQISFWEAPLPFDPVEQAQRWERLGTRLMVPGDRLEPTPKDPFLLEHARCSDVKRSADGRISFACFDKGGRWVAVFVGRERGAKDLSRIVGSVLGSSARTP